MANYYRQIVEMLDNMVKSRFIEMFGDCKETIQIGKVCSLHSRIGWQALTKAEHMATGEYMLITGTDFKDGIIDYTGCKYVSKDRYEMDPNIIIQNGDVLVTKDGTIGKVAVVKDLPKPATLNAGVFVVRNTDNQFLTEFIQQCLLSSDFQRFIESVKRGATIVHLNQEKFLKYELPVADLDLQHQFVDFVQQVDKSKVIALKAAEKYDQLVKSRFIELFKDCKDYVKLVDVIVEGAGLPYGIVQPGEDGSGTLKVIRSVDIKDNELVDLNSLKQIDNQLGEQYKRTQLQGNELLITVNGTTGKAILTDARMKDMNVTRGIAVARYDCKLVDPIYLREFIKSNESQSYFESHTKGAALKSITLADLAKLPVLMPPLEQQTLFSSFVKQVDKSKFTGKKVTNP